MCSLKDTCAGSKEIGTAGAAGVADDSGPSPAGDEETVRLAEGSHPARTSTQPQTIEFRRIIGGKQGNRVNQTIRNHYPDFSPFQGLPPDLRNLNKWCKPKDRDLAIRSRYQSAESFGVRR